MAEAGALQMKLVGLRLQLSPLLRFADPTGRRTLRHAREGEVVADRQGRNDASPLPILRHEDEAARDAARNALALDSYSTETNPTARHRPHACERLDELRAAGSQQSV